MQGRHADTLCIAIINATTQKYMVGVLMYVCLFLSNTIEYVNQIIMIIILSNRIIGLKK